MRVNDSSLCLDMSILSRAARSHTVPLTFNVGITHAHRLVRNLESTATDSTPATMHLDSENQQEDPGSVDFQNC